MLNIKKYADGRFFDTVNKKYINREKMEELVKKGESMKVTLTKTGKDITSTVIKEFSKKKAAAKDRKSITADIPFLNTESLKKWVGEAIDKRITKFLDAVNLPSREQVEQLDANIRELNKKIAELETAEPKKTAKKKSATPKKKAVKNAETPVKKAPAAEKAEAAAVNESSTDGAQKPSKD